MISSRQAAVRLEAVGVTRRQTRDLLKAGLAGPPSRTSSAVLYEEAAVDALASWPVLTDDLVDAACPWGLFIARQLDDPGLGRGPDTWAFSLVTSVWIWSRIERHGHLPFVSTICGFVNNGAEITKVLPVRGGGYQFQLRDPGPWFDGFRERRLLSGRGRPWVLRENRHGKLVG